jgi:phosphoglycerate-specific signal transduction histidine kinase
MTTLSERDTRIFAEVQADDLSFDMPNKLTGVSSILQIPNVTILTEKDNGKNESVVIIYDNGLGIDVELLPILFFKFVSKSEQGTAWGFPWQRV